MLLLTVSINLFQSKKPLDFPGRTLQQKRAGDERVQRVDMRKERVAVSMLCVSIRTKCAICKRTEVAAPAFEDAIPVQLPLWPSHCSSWVPAPSMFHDMAYDLRAVDAKALDDIGRLLG